MRLNQLLPHRSDIQPLRALQATRRLLADPDDTSQAFVVVHALRGFALPSLKRRLAQTEAGRRVLSGPKDQLLNALTDSEALRALPEGSLGRAYLAFRERHNITAEGLVAASEASERMDDPVVARIEAWLRDSHDLWHVVLGYETDLVGELSVLAVSAAQILNPGLWLIVGGGSLRFARELPDGLPTVKAAARRGRRMGWLPGVDWIAMLARPLDEVRAELGCGAAPSYTPIYSYEIAEAA